MPDTFYTSAPDWTIYIIPYFYIGGIAAGSYFLAAMLHWLGRPGDERAIRIGYVVAAIGVMISGLLLIVDLTQPLRFWHMLIQSERFPLPILKPWSPMSVGSWALLFFGLFATLSALGALASSGRLRWRGLRVFYEGLPGRIIALIGGLFAFFVAGYTGVLLSVSNRPIWADTNYLGVLFLFSAASTGAAALILLLRWRAGRASDATIEWLAWFDGWALLFELVALVFFVISLGHLASVWLSVWGLVLVLVVVIAGIILPLLLHFRAAWFSEGWRARSVVTGAVLALIGGLALRFAVLMASHSIDGPQSWVWR